MGMWYRAVRSVASGALNVLLTREAFLNSRQTVKCPNVALYIVVWSNNLTEHQIVQGGCEFLRIHVLKRRGR